MLNFKFFQQKAFLVTMDGYLIYPTESFISVNVGDLYRRGTKLPAFTIVERWPLSNEQAKKFKMDDTLVYFKYRKNAERYVLKAKKHLYL